MDIRSEGIWISEVKEYGYQKWYLTATANLLQYSIWEIF